VEGMGYVALSRVRDIDHLILHGLNGMALRVSPEALRLESELQERSTQSEATFSAVIAAAAEVDYEATDEAEKKEKKPGPWSEKLAKMRETYPNAYRPWKEHDDTQLQDLFKKGTPIDEMTTTFGRHPGSIKMRLEKLLGAEVELAD
jgi:hypothetical protein